LAGVCLLFALVSWTKGDLNLFSPDAYLAAENGIILEPQSDLPPPPELALVAGGDIMLSTNRASGIAMAKYGYAYPFEGIKEKLAAGDLTFANLESPISTKGKKLAGKGITFRSDPTVIEGLKYAGIDVVSLANNHILDYDDAALLETLNLLDEAGIKRVGAGKDLAEARSPVILDKDGLKVAFLAYSDMADIFFSYSYKKVFAAAEERPGVAPFDLDLILEDVKTVSAKADIVIVSLHWGVEDSNDTTLEQREMAYRIIDAGADAILGHHPHVLQGVEIYKGKPIAYSLGNLVFDQINENNKQSMILKLNYKDDNWEDIRAYPVYMEAKGHPAIASGAKKDEILNKIAKLAQKLGTEVQIEENSIVFLLPQNGN